VRPVAAAAENQLIKIVRGPNISDALDEICSFPHTPHDDCVDALSGAHKALARHRGRGTTHVARGDMYEIALRRRAQQRQPCSAREALLLRRAERDATARLAGTLGLPFYDSQMASR
jgi:hypothetical protein